jgi:hypothetical protein
MLNPECITRFIEWMKVLRTSTMDSVPKTTDSEAVYSVISTCSICHAFVPLTDSPLEDRDTTRSRCAQHAPSSSLQRNTSVRGWARRALRLALIRRLVRVSLGRISGEKTSTDLAPILARRGLVVRGG